MELRKGGQESVEQGDRPEQTAFSFKKTVGPSDLKGTDQMPSIHQLTQPEVLIRGDAQDREKKKNSEQS